MHAPTRSTILEGPIRSAVLWLALPVLGEQALNACVTWNDTFIAGRISAEATDAVGLASYISWFMSMIAWMVDTGATVIVARSVGAGNLHEARRTTNQAFILAILLGLFGMTGVLLLAPYIATVMNLPPTAAAIATSFLRIDTLGYLGGAISFALASCLRGAGDTRTPMMILGGVNVINVIFTWLLTFGLGPVPAMGTNGIAWGTCIARWAGAIWIVWLLQRQARIGESDPAHARPHQYLKLSLPLLRPDRALLSRILAIGLPAAADGALAFTGHFIFTTIVTRVPSVFSPTVLYAAHVVGIRIESLSYLPAQAWSVAASTMVGQNLGAGNPERSRQAANEAVKQAAMLLSFTGLLYFFAARPLYQILSSDPAVWECGVPALKGLACVQIPLAVLIVYLGALRGAGDTRTPMFITAAGVFLMRVPVAYLCGVILKGGLLGAWMGMFTDIVVRSGLLWWRFRSGRWMRVRI
ncbi:MAG: MATE family efflux transporter [Planctomycetota bacterium]